MAKIGGRVIYTHKSGSSVHTDAHTNPSHLYTQIRVICAHTKVTCAKNFHMGWGGAGGGGRDKNVHVVSSICSAHAHT